MSEVTGRDGVVTPGEQFYQEYVTTGLEKVRARLLDLSHRNRLLNFPARPSKQVLRLIDAVPDLVFQKLRNGQELFFDPIPRPARGLLTLETWANNPEVYLDEGTESEVAKTGAGSKKMAVEESARQLGISPSFDLPVSSLIPGKKEDHQDRDYVRALHYPDELERILKNIAVMSKTALEETGISTLYLVFGFLEWFEDQRETEKLHLAPLFLVPVGLNKGRLDSRTNTYPYSLEYSGEEIEINLTLSEKLKQLGLALPDLAEEETPEKYFSKLAPLLEGRSRWKIRRQMALTNLSFHKLRMWQDLDPAAWPVNSLLEHPRVREFFIGRSIDRSFSLADYSIDAPEMESDLPPLIYDADSSQHSALIDAIGGKNLVIEGPPGTGKSQTITNLIAAALFKGKTVLFVAEKSDALNVVESRLQRAGLGSFCLQLHSNKMKTKALALDLKQRLDQKNSYPPPATLAQKRKALEETRRQMIEYVEAINCKHGGGDRTVHQVIGAQEALRHQIAFDPSLVEPFLLPGAEELTIAQLEKIQQCAEIYGQSLSRLSAAGSLRDHPWFGVTKQPATLAEEQALLNALRIISEKALQLERRIESLTDECGSPVQPVELTIGELITIEGQLPVVEAGLRKDLLQPLTDSALRAEMRSFGGLLDSYRRTLNVVIHHFNKVPDLNASEIEILKNSCVQAGQLVTQPMNIAGLRRHITWISSFAAYLSRTADLFNQICRHLGCSFPFDTQSVSVIARVLGLLDEAPLGAFYYRHSALERDGIEQAIARAGLEAATLSKQATEISARIDWNLAPARELLPHHAVVCANANSLSFTTREFRLARRDWRGMSKQGRKASGEQMAADYRNLIEYFDHLHKFTSNPLYQEALGPLFNGLETPFDELEQLAKWYAGVKERLGVGSDVARQAAQALFSAPVGDLRALLELKRSRAADFEQLQKVFNNFQSALARLPTAFQTEANGDLHDLANRLNDLSAHLQTIASMFDEFSVETDLPFSAIPGNLEAVGRLNGLRERIQGDCRIAAVLGLQEAGPDINFAEIAKVLDFLEALDGSSLPGPVKQWLPAIDIEQRLMYLQQAASQIRGDYEQFQEATGRFAAMAGVTERDWHLAGSADSRHNFKQIHLRAQRALDAVPELTSWLAYCRARQALIDVEFEPVVKLAEEGAISHAEVPAAAMLIYHNSLLFRAFEKYPLLARFDGLAHEEVRRRFAAMDQEVIGLTREEIAWEIDRREVPLGNSLGAYSSYTELALIRRLVSQSNSKLKIRQLVERAGRALLALTPCFMMSPLSVAQFLPPGSVNFDLVVMDESSQLQPEDALGAIARGSQIVVVGDQMQLPPTNFFNAIVNSDGQDDNEEDVVDEAESVLDMAINRYQPTRMLKWHYRSRHESLIAFSNKEFYQGQLIIFPSPSSMSDEFGLKFEHVEHGIYENNRNHPEAEKVVAAVIEHLIDHPNDSLGVVGLNAKQRDLISELLDRKLKEHQPAEKRFEEWKGRGMEVFVKNLETVQGDERDVILISTTVGKNQSGQFKLTSFGALNNSKYGHRRLNVLITRARKRVVIFSSMDPAELQVSPNASRGVRALKDYLAYAKTGVLSQPRADGRGPDSEFEIAVARALSQRGYEVVPQVGVASYRIDLAVTHPRKPGSYILGIECDGATYHSSRSARDRDRLRQAVLEGLGWEIHRIWSTGWFRNRDQEIDKVVHRINGLL
ncbi:MAG TPA: DUF4011 domain-containing protein [Blastocatellia bacterium]|nr:DUF4011 domain-containing protein [Blastocatellia bacterium]